MDAPTPDDGFEDGPPRDDGLNADGDPILRLSLDGFEGPIDLLLDMARGQKVDLRRISVLALAEQYLAFVAEARRLRIDLAADYLVMAAWLAFLKSRLLLPEPPAEEGPSGAEMAERLAHRLARLEAMRKAAASLDARARLGLDIFARGAPEQAQRLAETAWRASLADLLRAYARIRTRDSYVPLTVDARTHVLALETARERLSRLLGGGPGVGLAAGLPEWSSLEAFLPDDWLAEPTRRRSALASSFAASLELARRGEIELRQEGAFAPLMLRGKPATEGTASEDTA